MREERAASVGRSTAPAGGSRRARWWGVLGLAATRIRHRIRDREGSHTTLALAGVAVATTLALTVTALGVGLAGEPTLVAGAEYRVAPPAGQSAVVVDVPDPALADAHAVATSIERQDGVAFATPVATAVLELRGPEATRRVKLVGVVPDGRGRTVAGLPTDALAAGDPHYAGGEYDGPWPGSAVLGRDAAMALGASAGASLDVGGGTAVATSDGTSAGVAADDGTALGGAGGTASASAAPDAPDRSLSVAAVESRGASAPQGPVAVVHLATLQRLRGSYRFDGADHVAVVPGGTVDASALSSPDGATRVVPTERTWPRLSGTGLPLAVSVAGVLVGVTLGALFVVTTVGFELSRTARDRAVLSALGTARVGRGVLVAAETSWLAVAGALAGVVVWLGVVGGESWLATATGRPALLAFRPALAVVAVVVAGALALLATAVLLAGRPADPATRLGP